MGDSPCGPSGSGDHWTVMTRCPLFLPGAAEELTTHSGSLPGALLSSGWGWGAGDRDLSCGSFHVITKFNFQGNGMCCKKRSFCSWRFKTLSWQPFAVGRTYVKFLV